MLMPGTAFLPVEGIEPLRILKQTHDYHFVLHRLHEHMPRYVMAALVARVNPERPEMLWKKYGSKFACDVQTKRVLYGLQAITRVDPSATRVG